MQNPSCIDLLLTNNVYAFRQTTAKYTGFLDCHKLVLMVLKTAVPKNQPKEITYRDYKQFDPSKFKKMFSRKKILVVVLSLINSFWKF